VSGAQPSRLCGQRASSLRLASSTGRMLAGRTGWKPVLLGGALALAATAAHAGNFSAADLEFFEKRVRPVLAEHCFECHGEKKQKGGLRLDSRAATLAGGDIGPAVDLAKPDESLLLKAVRYEDKDLEMPPKKRLPDATVADLAEWVKRGMPWPGESGTAIVAATKSGEMQFTEEMKAHWAFQPVRKAAVPAAVAGVADPGGPASPKPATAHPIDAFVREKLAAAGFAPAPPADARTFIRRLTFDLTGLPPTPEETEAFEREASVDRQTAVANATARLLASPCYGERWGRHWLDVARYADSNGSEVDHAMANAWRYRDYVVRAFNADKPFDRFIHEQLAGDLLPDAGADGITATGFLMLGPKSLAELDKPKLLADIVDEQVDTVGRAFTGMTLGCARCHDHKFDPVGDEDYYALAGIFRSTRTMDVSKRVATWTERPVGDAGDLQRLEKLNAQLATLRADRDKAAKDATAAMPKPALALEKGVLLVEAEHFTRSNVRVENDQLGRGIGVVRTRMEYPDHIEYDFELPAAGEYQLELRYAAKESRPTQLSINGNLEEMEAAAEVTGEWKPEAQRWFRQGVYRFRAGKNTLVFHRDGPVPLFDKWLVGPVLADGARHSDKLPKAPATTKAEPNDVTKRKLKEIDAAIAKVEDEITAIPVAMAPFDGPVADAPLLIRGNPATPSEIVPRGFLRVVHGLDAEKPGPHASGRLELARWLTHPQHPLTARVIVNRVWLWHFGEGLVRSPDNFGLRGEKPSHPELLDWLAAWFMENGWSLKKLHTLICTSATYQQTAASHSPQADPENRLLSHFPRRRLSAEELRDAMLAVSGGLDLTAGGSIMTVLNRTYASGGNAPPDVAKKMDYDARRRSLYLPIIRTALHDLFAAFDYPDPSMLTGQRSHTTVAPQALFLMNSPFVQERARAFAERMEKLGGDDATRVRAAYTLAFARPATDAEITRALAFLDRDEAAQREAKNDAPRATAWARLCHALLASNEFLYVR
jgi:mono/diheme cytochrome c family protein